MYFKVLHKSSKQVLAGKAKLADSFFDRLIGLMFRKSMQGFDALVIAPGYSVHTCFMRYNIDVLFISRENKVVKVLEEMAPWRFSWIYFRSVKVLELPGGKAKNLVRVGDEVEFLNV